MKPPSVPGFILVLAAVLAAMPAATRAADIPTGARIALVVGNNRGASGRNVLRYAESDVARVEGALAAVAGFRRDNIVTVKGGGRREFDAAVERVEERLRDTGAPADSKTLLLFYFSGHSDGLNLELGEDLVSFVTVKEWLAASPAAVRVAVIDACHSGGFAEIKGGAPGPAFDIVVDGDLKTSGMAVITSSSPEEKSQEDERIKGAYFTHHFVSALYGAADADRDGKVTLHESYRYSYGRTLASTLRTVSGAQHPVYEYNLEGKGDVVLSWASPRAVVIVVPRELEGQFFLLDRETAAVVAEFESSGAASTRLMVAAGNYVLARRNGRVVESAKIDAAAGRTVTVDPASFAREETYLAWARGAPEPPSTSVSMFYGLSGWMLRDMGPLHSFGTGFVTDLGPLSLLLAVAYGRTEVNDSGLRYSMEVLSVQAAPLFRIEMPSIDVLVGVALGSRLITQDTGPGGKYTAPTLLGGVLGGLEVTLLDPWIVTMTWEFDADVLELNDEWTVHASPRALLGLGYRY